MYRTIQFFETLSSEVIFRKPEIFFKDLFDILENMLISFPAESHIRRLIPLYEINIKLQPADD